MIKVSLIGFDQYLRRIQQAKKDVQAEVSSEIKAAGMMFRDGAKRDLVSLGGDTGGLANSITLKEIDAFNVDVTEEKFYAPFIEFGTKGKYFPIPGTEEIAAQFKGYKRGDFRQMVEAIKAWVKRKGIVAIYSVKTQRRTKFNKAEAARTEQAAWLIALSILKKGINPKPHFFKQINVVKPVLRNRIETILNGL